MAVHHIASPFTYALAVTPSDTTDNLAGASFIMNTGTSGTFSVRQDASYGNITVGLNQYDTMAVGSHWKGIRSTSLGAGVTIVKFC